MVKDLILGMLVHFEVERKSEMTFFLALLEFVGSTPAYLHKLLSIFGNGKKKQKILPPF
jgi:hypothetical protein